MDVEKRLLIIGSNRNNQDILDAFIKKIGYDTFRADSLEALMDILIEKQGIRLALFDITGFDSRVWQCCRDINRLGIPLFIITSRLNDVIKKRCLNFGINTIFQKPLIMRELANTIHVFMRSQND